MKKETYKLNDKVIITKYVFDNNEECFEELENIISALRDDSMCESEVPIAPSMDIQWYHDRLAARKNIHPKKLYNVVRTIAKIYPAVAYNLYLKEIAIVLDEKYEGHISNSEEIWVVNSVNNKPAKINKDMIESYENFAAFRTEEDAQCAINILGQL